uniref:CUB and zona pellucida-like domains 1, tandem duplicate 2 n=1 Tax=Sander lucioperca TaxID=283035 RepID=A0A8D0AQZ2_SANLU
MLIVLHTSNMLFACLYLNGLIDVQFYGSSGTFYSPNYPGPYPPNADCIWNITPGSRIVQLDFPIVNIEYHSNCGYDAIYVYDGPSTSYRLLGKVCGTNNITFHSTGTSLTVRFKSDNSVSRPGFRADFQVVVKPCGGSLFGSGTFSSPNHPNYYHDNAYCVWQLRAPYDQRIFLAFTYLQSFASISKLWLFIIFLKNRLENCCSCDYVSIYDGPSVSSRYLGKVCNNSLSSFYSTSNYLTVLFRTDGSVVGRGFKADFITSLLFESPSSDKQVKESLRVAQPSSSKT